MSFDRILLKIKKTFHIGIYQLYCYRGKGLGVVISIGVTTMILNIKCHTFFSFTNQKIQCRLKIRWIWALKTLKTLVSILTITGRNMLKVHTCTCYVG